MKSLWRYRLEYLHEISIYDIERAGMSLSTYLAFWLAFSDNRGTPWREDL